MTPEDREKVIQAAQRADYLEERDKARAALSPAEPVPATDPVRAAAEALVDGWDSRIRDHWAAPDVELVEALRAALAAEPEPVEITHEMNERAAEAAWQAWPNGIDDPSWAGLRIAVRAALAAVLSEARTEGGEPQ